MKIYVQISYYSLLAFLRRKLKVAEKFRHWRFTSVTQEYDLDWNKRKYYN